MARFANNKWENWNHAKGLGHPTKRSRKIIAFKNDGRNHRSTHAKAEAEMGLGDVNNVAYNPNYVVSLEVDKQGVVWAGTWGGGLSRFDGKWVSYTTADGARATTSCSHLDDKGTLWIRHQQRSVPVAGTGKFTKPMTTADGLANNVFAMAHDRRWRPGSAVSAALPICAPQIVFLRSALPFLPG